MRSLLLLRLLVLGALGGACGGGGASPRDIPLAQMPAAVKAAICAKIDACCSAAERQKNPRLGSDLAGCQAGLNRQATFLLADLEASVAAGRVVYHGDRLARCLADLEARSCAAVKMPAGEMTLTEICDGIIESRVALGGRCTEYWDCIGGWCAGDPGDTCVAIKPEGADCDEGVECASGICNDDRLCAARPSGSGSLCAIGTEPVGQHGSAP
jgi:hypothetical protein